MSGKGESITNPSISDQNTANPDAMNPATFAPPSPMTAPSVVIEFCDRVCVELQNYPLKKTDEQFETVSLVSSARSLNYETKALQDHRLHRASWVSTELFLTFPPPALKAVTLIPLNADDTAGRFRVWLNLEGETATLVWDRKVEGGFPELKVLVSEL